MVHKNYKWNISKEKGREIILHQIESILKEKDNMTIEMNELIYILNNRTKNILLTNNNKTKNFHNFIKNVFGGFIHFIDQYDLFMIQILNGSTYIRYNNLDLEDWILVTNNE